MKYLPLILLLGCATPEPTTELYHVGHGGIDGYQVVEDGEVVRSFLRGGTVCIEVTQEVGIRRINCAVLERFDVLRKQRGPQI